MAAFSVILVGLASFLGVFALVFIISGFIRGWALSVLWNWFAVPLFGLPALTVWAAYGLVLLLHVAYVVYIPVKDERSDKEKVVGFFGALVQPLIGVLLGWFVKGWAGL